MKRRALLSHLQGHGCLPVREGASHSIWSNPQTSRKEAVSRHNDIKFAETALLDSACAAGG